MIKRNLFTEISEGFNALADERAGKKTLRTHEVELLPVPEVKAEELIDYTRKDNVAERLVKRFGAAIGESSVKAMRALPALR